MITCKEDLIGFYVLRSDKEVFELFMDKCEEFGIIWATRVPPRTINEGEAVAFSSTGDERLGFSPELFYKNLGNKAITLADFKPTRTEYLKITDSIFDLKAEFEAGEVYTKKAWGEYKAINSEDRLAVYFELKNLYRKVECEITWQDEVEEYLLTCNSGCGMLDIQYGNGNQLALADEDFLEAARIALKVLGELK